MADAKRCSRCLLELPLSAFGVRRASPDGLQNYCRPCISEWAREHRPRKLKDPPAVEPGQKWCRRCDQVKTVEAFAGNMSAADGLQGQCRACAAAAYRARREAQGFLVNPGDVPDGHKFCRTCGTIKPHDAWSKSVASTDGLQSRCKACTSVVSRRDHLARSYGLTVEDVDRMLSEQGGLCAICRTAEAVHVDHDHATGAVRGLCCFRCNAALGQLGDDPTVVRRAADYLEAAARARSPLRAGTGSDRRSLVELAWRERLSQLDFGTAS